MVGDARVKPSGALLGILPLQFSHLDLALPCGARSVIGEAALLWGGVIVDDGILCHLRKDYE